VSTIAVVRNTLLACGLTVLATTTTAGAKSSESTTAVANFYNWYLAQHGNVDWYAPQHGHVDWYLATHYHTVKYFQARQFFHPDLFEELDQTYLKSIGDTTPVFYVSTTPAEGAAKMSNFDPYVGASSPATSYRIGSSWAGRVGAGYRNGERLPVDVTFVPVTFTFANARSKTAVTVIVRKNGVAYQIYDIHYGSIPFYYAGAISDLTHFLGAYNC
jgi:hypothetical protein